MAMRTFIAVGFGLGLTVAACGPQVERLLNQNHCANRGGNDWCVERYGDQRAYCEWGCGPMPALDGCVDARPAEDECYSPCGGEATALEDASCLGTASTGVESSSSGGTQTEGSSGSESSGSSTTGPMPCVSDEECTDDDAPFCGIAGECGTCEGAEDPDAACAGVDPALPLCAGEACVQCTAAAPEACTGETPVCDDATNTCVPCDAHEQCGEAACNLFTGACLPADAVVHVGPGQAFATLTLAISSFGAGAEGTIVVHDASYDESATVGGGRVLAFLASGSDVPRWIRSAGNSPQLTVPAGSTVLMDGVQVSGNASSAVPGVLVDGGRAWVDRGRIVDNNGGGILAQNAAELVLRNCFVGGGVNVIGVEVVQASASVLYSTVAASTFGRTPALGCTTPTAVDIRNAIIISQGGTSPDELSCAAATVVNTAMEADVGGFDSGWFLDFDAGDFSLSASGAATFADIAQWQTGDPPFDIDGNPRPGIDGSPDYAGADVP